MKRLEDQTRHAMLVEGDHDDRARQDFAFTFRNHVTSSMMPSIRTIYDQRAKKIYEKQNGRAPQSPKEIRDAVSADSYFRFYASARRTSQELIWASVTHAVERELPDLIERAKPKADALGSLTLNPTVKPPTYSTALDIHCMPGGYSSDYGPDDVAVGAIYDRGVHIYMSGLLGPNDDFMGLLVGGFLKRTQPDFAPKRILDMGCSIGHSTLPWAKMYPDAEIVAIDVSAPLLRYGHARAESMGAKVDFIQADAEDTGFAAGSFDLILSHIMLHETSGKALPRIMAESHRLLAPGGLMVHADQPSFKALDTFATFMQENETWYNNEPFWANYRRTDLVDAAITAGFQRKNVWTDVAVADVIRQSQNHGPIATQDANLDTEKAKAAGFELLIARKESVPSE
jgi:2-polyprenyl-3-methyl-5-hydroxy-6-metoxy-1,4-benzoquinol methylase